MVASVGAASETTIEVLHMDAEDARSRAILHDAGGAPRPTREVLDTLAQRPPLIPDPPGPTNIRRDNPRQQGEIRFGDAIGWFSRRLLTVSIPLADNQAYDLITDVDGALARVQVKTATYRPRRGGFEVTIETAGGNQSFHTRKPFDPEASEILYVLTDDGARCLIPSYRISAKTKIKLGAKWKAFRTSPPMPLSLPLDTT